MPKAKKKNPEQKLVNEIKKCCDAIPEDCKIKEDILKKFFSKGNLITRGLPNRYKRLKMLVSNDIKREKGEQLWYKCDTAKRYLKTMPKVKKEKAPRAASTEDLWKALRPLLERGPSNKCWNSSSGKD